MASACICVYRHKRGFAGCVERKAGALEILIRPLSADAHTMHSEAMHGWCLVPLVTAHALV